MKKTLCLFLLVFSVIFPGTAIVCASGNAGSNLPGEAGFMNDWAGLLLQSEREGFEAKASSIAERFGCGVYVFTVRDMYDFDLDYNYGSEDAFILNKALYNEYGLGDGYEKGCVILLLSMAERDYWLEVYGPAMTYFTNYGIDTLLDRHVLPELKEDYYYRAFNNYYNKADDYLEFARDGTPFDRGNDPDRLLQDFLLKLAATIGIPLLIAFIVCSIWKAQMKTTKEAVSADNYIPEGGFTLTGKSDTFLYRSTSRQRIERSSSSSGSHGGSSGRGGKF